MAILVDPPLWPNHDRVWGHLVSDSSLDELHAFAAAAGIPERAFDLDHYDVPAERYDALIAQGAELVDTRVARAPLARVRVARDRGAAPQLNPHGSSGPAAIARSEARMCETRTSVPYSVPAAVRRSTRCPIGH